MAYPQLRPRSLRVLAAAFLGMLLASCAAEDGQDDATPTAVMQTVTETVTPEHPEPSAGPDAGPGTAGASISEVEIGGPIPPQSTLVETVKYPPYMDTGYAILRTPSGNISCSLGVDNVRCGIDSYRIDRPYGTSPTTGIIDSIYIGEGEARLFGASDVAAWMPGAFGPDDLLEPQVVEYGEIVHYSTFVCLSEEKGLTCWDSVTGAGAFMSRERTDLF